MKVLQSGKDEQANDLVLDDAASSPGNANEDGAEASEDEASWHAASSSAVDSNCMTNVTVAGSYYCEIGLEGEQGAGEVLCGEEFRTHEDLAVHQEKEHV